MNVRILLRIKSADIESHSDGQCFELRVGIAGVRQLRLKQIGKLRVLFEGKADFIVEFQKVSDVIGVSTFLETVICLKLICDGFYLTELIDVILVRVAEPKVGADGVFVLVVLRSTVPVFLQQDRGLQFERIHSLEHILAFIEQSNKHCPNLFRCGLGKAYNHTLGEIVVGC